MELPLLVTPERVAGELGVGRTRVYMLIANGELPSIKVGRSRRITRDALLAYVARLAASADGERTSEPGPAA